MTLLSMTLLLLSLGLRSGAGDTGYLLRKPALLARSILAMNLLMPVLVILLVMILNLRPVVKVALVALSVSPVPPFLPDKMLRLTRHHGYVYGLLVASTMLALILVPLATAVLQHFQVQREHLAPLETVPIAIAVKILAGTVLLPLACGAVLQRCWPELASQAAPIMSKAGGVLLILALIPILLSQGMAILSLLGDGTLLAIFVFITAGLLIGHTLGGPDPRDRTVLALATVSRHPAVALAMTDSVFPDQTLAPAAILLALLAATFAAAPYSSRQAKLLHHSTSP